MLKLLLLLLATSINFAYAHKLKVLGTLSPFGSVEIYSSDIDGEIFYSPETKEIAALDLSVPVKSLDSGISLRNEHIHKFLNIKKYPEILMKDMVVKGGKGSAFLTINGVTKKIQFTVKKSKKLLQTVLKLNMANFKLPKAQFYHIGVDPEIKVFVDIEKKDIQKKVEINEKILNSI